jgi:hypothetical protein
MPQQAVSTSKICKWSLHWTPASYGRGDSHVRAWSREELKHRLRGVLAFPITPHLTYACDTHYPWQSESDELLVGGRVKIEHGQVQVQVPVRARLGAEIDQDALARGHERYERCGYSRRDDTAEMRKHVHPSWTRVVPAW